MSRRIIGPLLAALFFICSAVAFAQLPLMGVGGVVAWSPAQLPSLVVWLDAGLGVSQAGGVVSSWTDQSPNGYVFAQATTVNKPSFSATGFNTSFPGITVAAANPGFLTNSAVTLASTTVSVFITLSQTTSAQNNGGIFSVQANGQPNDFGTPPSFILESETSGTGFNAYSSSGLGNGGGIAIFGANTPATIGLIANGTNANLYINEAAQGAATALSSALGSSPNIIALGSRPWNGNTPSFDGTYASVIVTSAAISAGDLTKLSTYLSNRYGCTC